MKRASQRPRQDGSALLLAMVILTLIATLAAGMVWQQRRAIEVEAAERARTQAAWILHGALDWARLILREDARSGGSDHLGEPWAVPLAEARLSTFLAAEANTTDDDGPEAFLSGQISDLQARYNLRNLVNPAGEVVLAELAVLQRLCDQVGAASTTAQQLATGLAAAWTGADDAALAPTTLAQVEWLGIGADTVRLIAPYVTLLPTATPVNLNTAAREVIAAVIDGLDLGGAERLVQLRQRKPLTSLDDVKRALPSVPDIAPTRAGVTSRYFTVTGRLRLDDRVLVEVSTVERRPGGEVLAIRRERRSAIDDAPWRAAAPR